MYKGDGEVDTFNILEADPTGIVVDQVWKLRKEQSRRDLEFLSLETVQKVAVRQGTREEEQVGGEECVKM